jgi:hypothetical protein
MIVDEMICGLKNILMVYVNQRAGFSIRSTKMK